MDNAGSTLPLAPIFDITRDIRGMHPRPSGVGGQSDVYAAFWASPYEYMPVALKVLRFAGGLDEKIRKRLDSEISLWARVSHPNVQRLLGICFLSTSALPAMVSEWHPNGDITAYLKTKLHDTELQEIKYRLLVEVLEGVGYLHEHHIVHGDIKGANVLIAKDGSARLSDFGFSKILTEHSRSLSQWSAAKGTIRWMAPEFFAEDDRVTMHTTATDVWAIGCLIIEVQTGDVPYSAKRFEPSVILAISKGELPAPQPFEPDALWQLMRICCRVEPSARYTTSQLLSLLRIERLTSYLQADLRPAVPELPDWWEAALLEVRDHLRGCAMWHSLLEPPVRRVLYVLDALRFRLTYWFAVERAVDSMHDSVCELLAVCVDVARQQQPPTDVVIEFLVNAAPPLLHMLRPATEDGKYPRSRPIYPAEILRPLAKVLAEHGHASVALILMRFGDCAPALFQLGRDDSGALTRWSAEASEAVYAEDNFFTAAWSGDGTLFAIANGASVAIIQPGEAPSRTLPVGKSFVTRIAMAPNGQRVACSSGPGPRVTVSLWDIPSQSALDIGPTPAHIGPAQNLVFSQDGLRLASIHDNTAYVWRVDKNTVQLDVPPRTWHWKLPAIAFTADSHIVVAGHWMHEHRAMVDLRLYDPDTTALVTVAEIAAPPHNWTTTLCLYDTSSGQLVCCLETGVVTYMTCAASSLNGSHAAAGTSSGFVYVWDVETRMLLDNSPLPVHRGRISRLTFTSDGTQIITLTEKGEVCVSDIRGSWLRWDI